MMRLGRFAVRSGFDLPADIFPSFAKASACPIPILGGTASSEYEGRQWKDQRHSAQPGGEAARESQVPRERLRVDAAR